MSPLRSISDSDFEMFSTYLREISGITLGKNKKYLIASRLHNIMQKERAKSLGALLNMAKTDRRSKLLERIVDAMTTRETLWFRDIHPFDILKCHILPDFERLAKKNIRIWSAACSSGQEPYSIGIIIKEYLASAKTNIINDFDIMATDISPAALDEAKEGIYNKMAVSRGLSESRRIKFFTPKESHWHLKDKIKGITSFKELNLRKSYLILGKFDVIYCRNVLIYFSEEIKQDILTRLAKALNPGGYLFVGGSESIGKYTDKFEQVKTCGGVVNRLKD